MSHVPPQHRKLPGNCREVRQGRVGGGWRESELLQALSKDAGRVCRVVPACALPGTSCHPSCSSIVLNLATAHATLGRCNRGVCVGLCVCCERALAVVRVRLGGCMLTCGSIRWGCWSRCPARGFQQCLPCLVPRLQSRDCLLHCGQWSWTASRADHHSGFLHSSTCPSTAARAAASCSPSNVMLSRRVLDT
jgi:hypothetical protein